jgi:hypothetical protein
MPIVAKSRENVPPIDAGAYHAICVGVVDLGTQPPNIPTYRARQEVLLMWELPDERREYERDGVKVNEPRIIKRRFALFLGGSKPTELRKMLESWRGRPFTAEELNGFDLKSVLGANCLLTVVHSIKPTATYANVGSVSPLIKGTPKRTGETHPLYFTLSDIPDGAPCNWPPTMSEWLRADIMKSAEYITRFERGSHDEHDAGGYGGAPAGDDDDPIPF